MRADPVTVEESHEAKRREAEAEEAGQSGEQHVVGRLHRLPHGSWSSSGCWRRVLLVALRHTEERGRGGEDGLIAGRIHCLFVRLSQSSEASAIIQHERT